MIQQFTTEEAVRFHDLGIWQLLDDEGKVRLQLFQDKLCMPFDEFHKAIEKVLGRPAWTHEFAYRDKLVAEYLGEGPTPTFEDIMNLIPEEKRIILFVDAEPR